MSSGLAKATTGSCCFEPSREKVQVIGSLSYRGQNYIENYLKGNENCFELAEGSSYRGFELPEVDCIGLNGCYLVPRTSYEKVGSSKKILLTASDKTTVII